MKRSSIWVTIGAWLALCFALGAWGFSSPVGSSADDDFHLASIWCGQGEREGLCEAGSTDTSRMLPEKAVVAACYAHDVATTGNCQGDEFHENSFELVESERVNSGNQYPSGFYYVMSFFATENIATSVLAMRLFNSVLFATLITATAVLLPRKLRFVLTGSVALTLIPLSIFTIASTNPSSWSIMSNAILFPALLGVFLASGWRKWALLGVTLLSTVLSLDSRGDSAAFSIVAVLAATILMFQNTRKYWVTALISLALIVAAAIAFLSSGQTSLAVNGEMGSGSNPANASLGLTATNFLALPTLWSGVFGQYWGLGWLDTHIPTLMSATVIFIFSGVMFAALRTVHWRKIVALAGIGFTLIAFPLYVLMQAGSPVGANVQPRYLLPLITLFLAAALVPRCEKVDRFPTDTVPPVVSGFQLIMITAGLSAANSIALYFNLKRYVSGESYNLNIDSGWWWNAGPSPIATLIIGSLAGLVAASLFAVSSHRDLAPVAAQKSVDSFEQDSGAILQTELATPDRETITQDPSAVSAK